LVVWFQRVRNKPKLPTGIKMSKRDNFGAAIKYVDAMTEQAVRFFSDMSDQCKSTDQFTKTGYQKSLQQLLATKTALAETLEWFRFIDTHHQNPVFGFTEETEISLIRDEVKNLRTVFKAAKRAVKAERLDTVSVEYHGYEWPLSAEKIKKMMDACTFARSGNFDLLEEQTKHKERK